MLTIDQVKKIKWYRQSGAGIPLCVGLAFMGGLIKLPKKTGWWFPNDFAAFLKTSQGHNWFHYYDYYLTLEEVRKIFKKVELNIEFFWQMKKDFYPAGDRMEKIGKELLTMDVESDDFKSKYNEFIDQSLIFWENSVFIDLLDPFEEEIISFIFGDKLKDLSKEELNLLLSPDELSHFQKEQKELLEILEKNNPQLLKEHSDKYYWLKNDYEKAEYLDEAYYQKEMQKLINRPKLREDIKRGLRKFNEMKESKAELIKKLQLDGKKLEKLNFFNWVTTYRDDRKKFNQISNYFLIEVAKKIVKKFDLEYELLINAMPDEIIKVAKDEENIRQTLEIRKNGVLLFSDSPGSWGVESGEIAQQYFESLEQTIKSSEIKGMTASAGKAIGTVKIISNQSDFHKMRKGDVLVASMTRPEYVPIMKKAVAIVTDEGGITSHAAIVSRELGIPCITGTQIATRSLHDGDLIDVNANHGLIKIIKKAE